MLCFINTNLFEELKKIIIEKLISLKKYNKFIEYLKRTWFKKGRIDYNYSDIIKKYYNNNDIINKMFLTNNIIESIHSKINQFLPKHKTTVYNFIKALENIIFNDTIKYNILYRTDFKTRSLLLLLEKENLINELHWVKNDIFEKYYNDIKSYNSRESNISELSKKIEINNRLNKNIVYNTYLKGLKNLGTTCYINTIIQMLFNIEEVKNYILNLGIKKESHNVLYSLYIIFYNLNDKINNETEIDTTYFLENFDGKIINPLTSPGEGSQYLHLHI